MTSGDFFMKCFPINEECPGTLSDTEAIMKKLI